MKLLVLIILFILSAACSNEGQTPVSGGQPKINSDGKTLSKPAMSSLSSETRLSDKVKHRRFTPYELVGHKLTLLSKTAIGEYSFIDRGYVGHPGKL